MQEAGLFLCGGGEPEPEKEVLGLMGECPVHTVICEMLFLRCWAFAHSHLVLGVPGDVCRAPGRLHASTPGSWGEVQLLLEDWSPLLALPFKSRKPATVVPGWRSSLQEDEELLGSRPFCLAEEAAGSGRVPAP